MRRKQVNKKPLLLLLVFTLFSFLVVKNTSKFNLKKEEVLLSEKQPAECNNCQVVGGIQENIGEETANIVFLDQSQTVDITNQAVLGQQIDCGGLDSTIFLEIHRPVCSKDGSGEIDFSGSSSFTIGSGGVTVDKNSDIEVTKITYPSVLWRGQATYVTSNKQITKNSPEYRSNGKHIDLNLVARTLAPDEVSEFTDFVSETEKTPFTVQAKVNLLGSVENIFDDSIGEYKITDPFKKDCTVYGKSCDKVFKESAVTDFNIGKSNRVASDGYLSGQAPKGDGRVIQEEEGCLVEGRHYSKIDKELGVVEACNQKTALLSGLFKKTFSLLQWTKCHPTISVATESLDLGDYEITEQATGKCIDTKGLGIKMTTLFGEPDRLEDDLAGNAYLSQLYGETLSPAESKNIVLSGNPKNSEMFFVATDCAVSIDGTPYSALCLWDASPILYNYKLQERDTAPQQEDFPDDFASYWRSVLKSVKKSYDRYKSK